MDCLFSWLGPTGIGLPGCSDTSLRCSPVVADSMGPGKKRWEVKLLNASLHSSAVPSARNARRELCHLHTRAWPRGSPTATLAIQAPVSFRPDASLRYNRRTPLGVEFGQVLAPGARALLLLELVAGKSPADDVTMDILQRWCPCGTFVLLRRVGTSLNLN
jgi:hypothetical protein